MAHQKRMDVNETPSVVAVMHTGQLLSCRVYNSLQTANSYDVGSNAWDCWYSAYLHGSQSLFGIHRVGKKIPRVFCMQF